MEKVLPEFPVWITALFGVLIVFVGDILKGGWKQPMIWVSLVLGQVLCHWLGFDLFAKVGLTPTVTIIGVILTALTLSAVASKAIYPASAAAIEFARAARSTD